MRMPEFRKLSKLQKYGAAISFLAMEIFALIAFSFGSSFVLYGALSLALLVLLILFNIKEIKVDGISSIAFFFLPLFLFTVITAFGIYSRSHAYRGDYSTAELVFIPLGLLPMSFCGYMLRIDKTFKISTFLIVIYSALGVLCLVNLGSNLVNFGPFYNVIYKGYRMYYGGMMSEVTVDKMAYVLEGFKFIEVSIYHYILYPVLLLTSSAALFYVSPKENRKLFIVYCIFTFVAVISLVFVPTMMGLYTAIIVGLIDVVIFFLRKYPGLRKPAKYVLYAGIVIVGLVYLGMILNKQSALPFGNIIANNGFLNKLFNTNGYVNKYNPLIEDVFSGEKFLGYAVNNSIFQEEVHMSGSFFFDFFMTSGVIGVIAFIFAITNGYLGFKKYFLKSNDEFYIKACLIAFVTFFLIYSGTFNDTEYGVFYDIFKPIYMTGPFMLVIFIFSYVLASAPNQKEEKMVENVEEVKTNE